MKLAARNLLTNASHRQRGKTMRDNLADKQGLTQGTILVPFDALEGTLIPETDHVRFYYTHTESDTFHQIAVATAATMAGPFTNYGSLVGMGIGGAAANQACHSSVAVKANGFYYIFASNGYGDGVAGQDRCLYLFKSSDGLTGWSMVGQVLNKQSFTNLGGGYGNTSLWPEKVNGQYLMLTEISDSDNIWRIHRAIADNIEGPWTITQELTDLKVSGMYGGACHKYISGKWHCWYHYGSGAGVSAPGDLGQNLPTWLAYATSLDGISWAKVEAPYFRVEAQPYGPAASITVGTTQLADPWVEEITENGVPYVYHTAEYVENSSPTKNQTRWWRWQGTLAEFVTNAQTSIPPPIDTTRPKKLVFDGDSLVNPVLTTTSRAIARLNKSDLETAIISHPGESGRDYLNNHMAETADAVDSTKDCYLVTSLDTNGLNQFYIDQLKADTLQLANAWLQQGYKGIVWMQVAACQSPFAYARDAQGNIIGTTTAERQAGFDNARLAYNSYLQSLVTAGKLYAVGNLSVYNQVYPQAQASDARYFYPASQGPYGNSEPGKVHYTDYGARYWAEACAQAVAPMLGITLSPATITIPDAPAIAQPVTTQLKWRSLNGNTTTASNGSSATHAGSQNWDGNVVTDYRVPLPGASETVVLTFPAVNIPSDGPGIILALTKAVQVSGFTGFDYAQYFSFPESITFLAGGNQNNGGDNGSRAYAPSYGDIEVRITRTAIVYRHKASGTAFGTIPIAASDFPLEIQASFGGAIGLAAPSITALAIEPSSF